VDVFGTDGTYEGTLDAAGIPAAFASDARFVAFRILETGEPRLSLYMLRGHLEGAATPRTAGGGVKVRPGTRAGFTRVDG
jgi:hypothetical protein